ncbi:MAG: histidine phosphatase family protein [Hyphomicrobiaceae bacterium]|nr:histidine phosphatase family protein [Hyphomicrobiaceae bacterium]
MVPLAMIRHGPTAWNSEKRLQGRTDVPLSEEGRETVLSWRVPEELKDYQWVASPLSRAVETARLLGASVPAIEPRLREMHYGNWEGRSLPELRQSLGEVMAENEARGVDFQPDGGERPRDVQERLSSWLADLGRSAAPTVAVSHHGVLRALYALATGWNMVDPLPEKFQWGAMQCFHVSSSGEVSVDRINVSIEAT